MTVSAFCTYILNLKFFFIFLHGQSLNYWCTLVVQHYLKRE